jgi:hypothetical protein
MRKKVIVCPNKDKPGVREAVEAAYKEWTMHKKKQFKKCKDMMISYDKLSNKDKAKIQDSLLASLCAGARTDDASTITANLPTNPQSPPSKQAR